MNPPPSTQAERAAAFEWLRAVALGKGRMARHAVILLAEIARLNKVEKNKDE